MIFLAMPLLTAILSRNPRMAESLKWFSDIHSYPFTYGPFLYIFTRNIISGRDTGGLKDLIHFIPFIIFGFFSIYLISIGQTFIAHHPENNFGLNIPAPPQAGVRFYGIATLTSLLCYTMAVMILLRKHSRNLPDYFSAMPIEVTLNWLRWITIGLTCSVFYVIISGLVAPGIFRHPLFNPAVSNPLSITFFIIFFLYFNLRQPEIYKTNLLPDAENRNINSSRRYEKSGLKEEDAEKFLSIIDDYMRREKPYREGDLTILDLSEKLGIQRHYITQVINENLKKNFYMYVNEFRVNEVKEKFLDSSYDDHTLLRIALDAGFNSKSSFNLIFKKFTGMTPSDYRKNIT